MGSSSRGGASPRGVDGLVATGEAAKVFELLAPSERRQTVAQALVAATLAMMAWIALVEMQYKTEHAPLGVVSFEMAATQARGERIVRGWTPKQRILVAYVLGLDYLFMVVYSLTICYCCLWAAEVARHRRLAPAQLVAAGETIGYAQFVALVCDAIENQFSLYGLLNPGSSGPAFPLATVFAAVKFAIILFGLGWCAFVWALTKGWLTASSPQLLLIPEPRSRSHSAKSR